MIASQSLRFNAEHGVTNVESTGGHTSMGLGNTPPTGATLESQRIWEHWKGTLCAAAVHHDGGGQTIGPWAVPVLMESSRKVLAGGGALDEEALAHLNGALDEAVGFGVVLAAELVVDRVGVAEVLEDRAGEFWPAVTPYEEGKPKVEEPGPDGGDHRGSREFGEGGDEGVATVAVHHDEEALAAGVAEVHTAGLHREGAGARRDPRSRRERGAGGSAGRAAADAVRDGGAHAGPVV